MTLLDINLSEHHAEPSKLLKASNSAFKEVQSSFDIKSKSQSSSGHGIKIEKEKYQKEIEGIVLKAAEQMNEVAKTFDRSIKFVVHEESGRLQTEVIDKASEKVIREIPSDEVLDMISKLKSTIGTILDIKS